MAVQIDEGVVQFFAKVVGIGGVCGYVIHAFYTRYNKFKDTVWEAINEIDKDKLSERRCIEYRGVEGKRVDSLDTEIKAVDADLQRHKEAVK
jgi:hypothetical protein